MHTSPPPAAERTGRRRADAPALRLADPTAPAEPGTTTTRRRRARRAARLLAALASIALAVRVGGLGASEMGQAWHLLGDVATGIVMLLLALQVLWAWSLARVLAGGVSAVGGSIGPVAALRTSMAGFTLSRTVPGGGVAGGLFAGRELTRMGHRPGLAIAALTTSWAVTTTCLAAVLLVGGIGVAVLGEVPLTYAVPAGVGLGSLAAVGAVVLVALRRPGVHARLVALATWGARLVGRRPPAALQTTLDQIGGAMSDGRHLGRTVAWSLVSWATDLAAVWLAFAAFGHTLDLTALVIGYASINLLNSIPELTPGWIGVFEAGMAATFTGLGAPAEVALASTLVYRLVSFWLPVAAGIVPAVRSLAVLRRHEVEARDTAEGAAAEQATPELVAA